MFVRFLVLYYVISSDIISCQYSPTCLDSPFKAYAYCNISLPLNQRVNDLFSRLTLHEKVNLTNRNQGGVSRLALPPLQSVTCSHGANWKDVDSRQSHPTTLFPQTVTLSQSWDRNYFKLMARAISDESRAAYNTAAGTKYDSGHGQGLICGGPNVNICRDPRWGRCQESFGEDPLLTSELSKGFIHDLQYNAQQPNYVQIGATCKHFDVHSGGGHRASFDSIVRYDDWYGTYLKAFESCVAVEAVSIMCSYNEINGIPACGNRELLVDILREKWNYTGFVTADCGAVSQIYSYQNYTRNFIEASQVAFQSGMDMNGNCGPPSNGLQDLYDAVINETFNIKYLDRAVKRNLQVWFKLGLMDGNISTFDSLRLNDSYEKHKDLNFETAVKSIVLLENRDNILPLNMSNIKAKKSVIGVIGPCINNTQCYIGDYSENNPPFYSGWITPLNELLNSGFNILYASGCNLTSCDDMDNASLSQVINVVNKADIIFYIGGISIEQESEGRDRTDLQLPYNQSLLFEQIYAAANNKTIISIICYGAPFIDSLMFSKSNGLIGIGYLGMKVGPALISIINGTISPMAKTSITWYENIAQLPQFADFNMMQVPYGRTYRYFNSTPHFSFGYGKTYTVFEYNNLALMPYNARIIPCQSVSVNVTVTNMGNTFISDEITQLYLSFPDYLRTNNIANHTDRLRLVNFTRTYNIGPRQTVAISLTVSPQLMTVITNYYYDEMIYPGMYTLYIGDNLNQTQMLTTQFEIVGGATKITNCM